MIRPLDSSVSYSLSTTDITWNPPGPDFPIFHSDISEERSRLDSLIDGSTFSGDSADYLYNETYDVYERIQHSGGKTHSIIFYDTDKEQWSRIIISGTTVTDEDFVTTGSISDNVARDVSAKWITITFPYLDSDNNVAYDDLPYLSRAQGRGKVVRDQFAGTLYQKHDKMWTVMPGETGVVRVPTAHTTAIDSTSDSYTIRSILSGTIDSDADNYYAALIVPILPLDITVQSDDSVLRPDRFKFGWPYPIVKDKTTMPAGYDSWFGFQRKIHEAMTEFVLDSNKFDYGTGFTYESFGDRPLSEAVNFVSSELDSAKTFTQTFFDHLETVITTYQSTPLPFGREHSKLDFMSGDLADSAITITDNYRPLFRQFGDGKLFGARMFDALRPRMSEVVDSDGVPPSLRQYTVEDSYGIFADRAVNFEDGIGGTVSRESFQAVDPAGYYPYAIRLLDSALETY